MRKVKQTKEKTPPLPKDKPATYNNESRSTSKIGNRQSEHQPKDRDAPKNPQKTREKLEQDLTKRETDPGINSK